VSKTQRKKTPERLLNLFKGQPVQIGIVVSRFNSAITDELLKGAVQCCLDAGIPEECIDTIEVPGAFEIPVCVRHLLSYENHAAVICLGAIIKGETSHHRNLARAVFPALQNLACESGVPIGLGILTAYNEHQAQERSGGKQGNKGIEATAAALELLHTLAGMREENE